ncbi:MAG TPA: Stf0 family sulfotransferase [Chloroflexota bacterium]|nr:Stf0 family sulfotransferase [Chloroflexota bacterium]
MEQESSRQGVRDLEPHLSYFVCFTPRSGSTLLCEALHNTGVAGHPEEYFNRLTGAYVGDPLWKQEENSVHGHEYFERVLAWGTTPNGVFALKVAASHLEVMDSTLRLMLPDNNGTLHERIAAAVPNAKYLLVTRRDKVKQAVSLVKAKQTGRWMARRSERPQKHRVAYNFHLIDSAVREILDEEAYWARYFARAGIMPHCIVYEDLVLDTPRALRGVMEYLNISLPRDFILPASRLSRQADEVSASWVQRYETAVQGRTKIRNLANIPLVLAHGALRETYVYPRAHQLGRALFGLATRRHSVSESLPPAI